MHRSVPKGLQNYEMYTNSPVPLKAATGPVSLQVAAKIAKSVQDMHQLRDEAEVHTRAWSGLDHVLRPLGFLAAHGPTRSPAMLVTEIAM